MYELTKLAGVNLNLLLPLQALLQHRNVSAAAESLNITQPTMSRHLAGLRKIFDDNLLVRVGNGYQLTPRAGRLKDELEPIIKDVYQMFSQTFDPDQDRREFSIAAPDFVGSYVLSKVLAPVLDSQPKISFSLINWDMHGKSLFMDGLIDFVISLDDDFGPNFRRRNIGSDHWVCIARNDHPIFKKDSAGLEDMLEYRFGAVRTGGGADKSVEQVLRANGLKRKIQFTTQGYLSMFAALRHSDLIAFIPNNLTQYAVRDYGLGSIQLPEMFEKIRYSLYWHEKFADDKAHQWVRETLFPKVLCHHF